MSLKIKENPVITHCYAAKESFRKRKKKMKRSSNFASLFGCAMFLLFAVILINCPGTAVQAGQTEFVIVISVDGGGSSYIENLINQGMLPHFNRLRREGAWTHNARSDYDNSSTLPNHVTMVTARGVRGRLNNGHSWVRNTEPPNVATQTDSIQGNNGSYVHCVFDVAHDNGLRTGLFTTKRKFALFEQSYNNGNGDPDTTGIDNGRSKISMSVNKDNSQDLMNSFIAAMNAEPFNYVLVHFRDPDDCGHKYGWGSAEFNKALATVDGYLGRIFAMITENLNLAGKVALIVTADHGGVDRNHNVTTDPLNYTIPFYVWGPDVEASKPLYALNTQVRLDPGTSCPSYGAPIQPIRNGDSANLAMAMLGLGIVPDSTINNSQDLRVNSKPPINDAHGSAHKKVSSSVPSSRSL